MNQATVVGNLGRNPEVRFLDGSRAVATLTVATNERWTDKQGQGQERVEWHRCVVWGKLAEVCGENLAKGAQVLVQGRLQTREWPDKAHPDVKHHTTEIHADTVLFLGSKGRPGEPPAPTQDPGRPQRGGDAAPAPEPVPSGPGEDDIPF